MGKKELNILTLGERGQVTLPKVMRQRLGLGKNSKVAATMVGKTIVLYPIDDELEALFDSIALKLKGAGVTEKELLQRMQKARKRIYRQNYSKGNNK